MSGKRFSPRQKLEPGPSACRAMPVGWKPFPLPEGVTSPIVFEILLRGYSEKPPLASFQLLIHELGASCFAYPSENTS
jgi:hypothetical protein